VNTFPVRTRPIGPNQGIEEIEAVEDLDDPTDDIWHVQVAASDVRVVTLDKLNDLFRFDVIDEQVFVWQKGMTDWVRLSTLLGAQEPEPEEPFHVLLGPGNVKPLTLEQLDDFYRHEVIDEDTLVWQEGMSEWQTLGKVAGITAQASSAPFVQPPQLATYSAPPVAFNLEPPQTDSKGGARWLVRFAIAAGVVLALLRNDLVFSMLQETPLAARYATFESSIVGGPVYGTSRSVEQLVAECGGHLQAVRLPIAVTEFVDAQKLLAARAKPLDAATTTKKSDTVSAPLAIASSPAMAGVDKARAPATTTTAKDGVALARGPATANTPSSQPLSRNVAATKTSTSARTVKKRASSGKSALRANGSYFDPLNPSL
jgi:hypothetical protein